ncbi:uncharacterized protein [Eurosta solidaginis]|uniref:uncharacterized protein isoform X2 n=1 Tax=Eurosta solidaginis TaxID=178769 RepID=UPI003530859D
MEQVRDYFQLSDDDLEYCEEFNEDDREASKCATGNTSVLGTRGSYERAWTTEATRALINIRGPMQGMFTEGRQKRTALWLHCTRQLHKMGYRHSAAKVQKKWHNILITYTKNLPKKNSSNYVHWEFFEDMHKYLKDRTFESYNLPIQPMQPMRHSNPIQHEQQLQQQQPLSQPPPMTFHQKLDTNQHQRQSPHISAKDLMAQYGDANQLALLAHTADANMTDKSNDEFDDDSTNTSEFKQPKLEFNPADLPLEISHSNGYDAGAPAHEFQPPVINAAAPETEGVWWKDYFERKLEVEREKIQCQKELHREQMQFQKMSLVQQEKIERLKIDAINSLTATLQKLVEAKNRKT